MPGLSLVALVLVAMGCAYHYLLAVASLRPSGREKVSTTRRRFVVAIAAHDEQRAIGATIRSLRALDYPAELVEVHVVADHCTDETAERARREGAQVHERHDGPRTGKGAALTWLFDRILEADVDAVVVFDADTRVDAGFLKAMNTRLDGGERVLQGQHVIRNPQDGWFPALVWAMFLIDNRFQNLGRENLGWSAKNMGDSICFDADVLRRFGWGSGLTDDYELRQRLLLHGVRIAYTPAAKGYGEAAGSVQAARTQRLRWIAGARESTRVHGPNLLREAFRRRDTALLDAWLQGLVPSYSLLTFVAAAAVACQWAFNELWRPLVPPGLLLGWAAVVAAMSIYPFLGLALEGAPAAAYRALAFGPVFVVWRVWLTARAAFGRGPTTWVRTAHGE